MIHMANHLQCLFIHLCTSYTGDWRKHVFLCSSQTRTDGSVNPAAVLGLQLCNFWKGRLVCEHWKWLSQLFSFCCLLSNATLQVTFLISMLLLEYLPAFHVHLPFLVLSDSLCFLYSCLLKFSSVFFSSCQNTVLPKPGFLCHLYWLIPEAWEWGHKAACCAFFSWLQL